MAWIPRPRNLRRRIAEEGVLFTTWELVVQGWSEAEDHLGWLVAALIAGLGILADLPLWIWPVVALGAGFFITIFMGRAVERHNERAAAAIARQLAPQLAPGMEATIPLAISALEERLEAKYMKATTKMVNEALDQFFDGLAPEITDGLWKRIQDNRKQQES